MKILIDEETRKIKTVEYVQNIAAGKWVIWNFIKLNTLNNKLRILILMSMSLFALLIITISLHMGYLHLKYGDINDIIYQSEEFKKTFPNAKMKDLIKTSVSFNLNETKITFTIKGMEDKKYYIFDLNKYERGKRYISIEKKGDGK
jgi:hypothetical protein